MALWGSSSPVCRGETPYVLFYKGFWTVDKCFTNQAGMMLQFMPKCRF